MNGPEHYAEAERLLRVVDEALEGRRDLTPGRLNLLTAKASVHATLSLAAATAGHDLPPAPERPAPLPDPVMATP